MTLNSLVTVLLLFCGTKTFALDVGWFSAGSGYAAIGKTKPTLSNELSGGATLYAEIDAIKDGLIGPHYAYRKTYAENNQVDLSITTHEFGASIALPLPIFDIFLGVGGINGGAMAEDKATGIEDRKNVSGYYARGGIDILVNPYFGIRGSYQSSTISLKDFSPTDDLSISQNIYSVGLVLRGGDSPFLK